MTGQAYAGTFSHLWSKPLLPATFGFRCSRSVLMFTQGRRRSVHPHRIVSRNACVHKLEIYLETWSSAFPQHTICGRLWNLNASLPNIWMDVWFTKVAQPHQSSEWAVVHIPGLCVALCHRNTPKTKRRAACAQKNTCEKMTQKMMMESVNGTKSRLTDTW